MIAMSMNLILPGHTSYCCSYTSCNGIHLIHFLWVASIQGPLDSENSACNRHNGFHSVDVRMGRHGAVFDGRKMTMECDHDHFLLVSSRRQVYRMHHVGSCHCCFSLRSQLHGHDLCVPGSARIHLHILVVVEEHIFRRVPLEAVHNDREVVHICHRSQRVVHIEKLVVVKIFCNLVHDLCSQVVLEVGNVPLVLILFSLCVFPIQL